MRTLTLTLRSETGLQAEHTFPSVPLNIDTWIVAINEMQHRLDVLERDGPWKPEVQNSLQPAPKVSEL